MDSGCGHDLVNHFDNLVGFLCDIVDYSWDARGSLSGIQRVQRVSHALYGRGISDPHDLPLCIAILLDLDLTALTSIPPLYSVLPIGLLSVAITKHTDRALRWALQATTDIIRIC